MKQKHSIVAGALIMLLATGCTQDLVEEFNTTEGVSFRATTGRADVGSRADNITTDALWSFKVWAYGTKHDGTHCTFIPGDMVNNTGTGVFETATTYYWPTDITHMDFYGIGATNRTSSDANAEYENGRYTWTAPNETTPGRILIEGFKVRHNPPHTWEDANNTEVNKQEDVIVALTHRDKAVNNEVYMRFNHVMSSINLKAHNTYSPTGHDGEQVIYIKGAWIVTGDKIWDFTFNATNCDGTQPTGTKPYNWLPEKDEFGKDIYADSELPTPTVDTKVAAYGQTFSEPIEVKSGQTIPLLLMDKGTNIILPSQKFNGWPAIEDGGTSSAALTDGAYIMLLVRVEIHEHQDQHKGEKHQLFPYTGHFGAQEYSYVCVPITHIIEPGYNYTYTINMLGENGLGQYPPSNHPMPVIATADGNTNYSGMSQTELDQPRVVVYRSMTAVSTTGTHPQNQASEETDLTGEPIIKKASKTFGSPVLEKKVTFNPEVQGWNDKGLQNDYAK